MASESRWRDFFRGRGVVAHQPESPPRAIPAVVARGSGPPVSFSRDRTDAELRAVLDSVDNGILILDMDGRVRYVNTRLAQLFGLDLRTSERGRDFDSLLREIRGSLREAEPVVRRWREQARVAQQPFVEEVEVTRPSRRVIERLARPILGLEGRPVGWLEVYRDVTGARLIQTKLLQTEKMAAIGQLVSGIAHELNNPLTSIQGYAQLLLAKDSGPERSADAKRIYQEAERAARIVKNLLLFARETRPEPRPVNLNEIVERTLALRSYELKVENIAVECDLERPAPITLADSNQIQQVLLNLIVNAEHAMQSARGSGRLRLRTRRVGPARVALEVSDDGPGIPREIQSRIFDPFFTTKPVGIGTGLGLSLVYGIVHQHGGDISVDSEPGRGTTFLVELPLLDKAETDLETGGVRPPELEIPMRISGRHILIIEDEPTVAQLVADVLVEEGHRVDVFLNSREAVRVLSQEHYDLVICDLKMPELDGRAVHEELVRSGNPIRHRFLLVTGDTLAPRTVDFLEKSGLPHLAKPFLVEELKRFVKEMLAGSGEKDALEPEVTAPVPSTVGLRK